jgi:hypothetical protein
MPSPEETSGPYEFAEVQGRLAQRLYELGNGLYELPEDRSDVVPVLFNVGGSSGSTGPFVY